MVVRGTPRWTPRSWVSTRWPPGAGGVIVGFRVPDNLVHGWELARACGADVDLPEVLAERCLDFWLPLAGSAGMGAHFGGPVVPPEGASAGVRLLSLLGRTV